VCEYFFVFHSIGNIITKIQNLDLSLISYDIIDHIVIPMMDVKLLHYLRCTSSQWRPRIQRYMEKCAPNLQFITKLSLKGCRGKQFNQSCFVADESQGNIYVSDSGNHRIQKFDSNVQWKISIRLYGLRNDRFGYPMELHSTPKISCLLSTVKIIE